MEKIPYNQLKVLLVDPQRPFQVMMKGILTNFGIKKIDFADNGEVAVRQCRGTSYNILLVEYNLGSNKNGRQLLEELRTLRLIKPDALFIVISGETNRAAVLGTMEMQPDDYIIKPFSQRLLDNRIQKAWAKRHAMSSIYYCLQKNDYPRAIIACKTQIKEKNRYSAFCLQMMTEFLCKESRYEEAMTVLNTVLKERTIVWAQINLARANLGLEHFDEAIALIQLVLKQQPTNVEAIDLLANIQLKSGESQLAQVTLSRSISISPYSMKRHTQMIEVATTNQDFNLIKDSYGKLLYLSRRSVHAGTDNLCNYLRSIVVAIENSDEKTDIYKLQNEMTTTLQRAKNEEGRNLGYQYSTLEGVMQAQLHSAKGETLKAKKMVMEAIHSFCDEDDNWDLPVELAPDTCITLINIHDYELAAKFSRQLGADSDISAKITKILLSDKIKDRHIEFNKITKAGIEAYSHHDNLVALELFQQAITLSPVNSGAALNLIQVQTRLMQQHKKYVKLLMTESKETLRLLNGVKLSNAHHKRYTKIKREFDEVVRKHSK
ncbi:MAG: response regulator [Gammaproteobacteria bacterium]|nr:response regulator [Gammaproteobacteria bacterium]